MCLIELIKNTERRIFSALIFSIAYELASQKAARDEICVEMLFNQSMKVQHSPATCKVAFRLLTTPNSFFASHQYTPPSFLTALLVKQMKVEKKKLSVKNFVTSGKNEEKQIHRDTRRDQKN